MKAPDQVHAVLIDPIADLRNSNGYPVTFADVANFNWYVSEISFQHFFRKGRNHNPHPLGLFSVSEGSFHRKSLLRVAR